MSSPTLGITHVVDAQANKSVTVNAAIDALDEASNALAPTAMTDADLDLTTAQLAAGIVFVVTGTLTAGRNLIVPATARRFVVKNGTTGGFTLTVKTSGGTGVALSDANYHDLFCDGTNVVAIS